MHTDKIPKAIYDDLLTWVQAQKGRLCLARDPLEVIELLTTGPLGFVVILGFGGDGSGQEGTEDLVTEQKIEVTVGMNLGLEFDKGLMLFKTKGTRVNLLRLFSLCRARVLSLSFPASTEDTGQTLRYGGSEAVTMPSGFPLSAYKFSVHLDAVIETDEPREAVIEEGA